VACGAGAPVQVHGTSHARPGRTARRDAAHASSRQYANHTRNRPAWLLLGRVRAGLVRADAGHHGHATLTFRLYATGRVLAVDGGHLTLVTTRLNSVTMITGFAVFAAVRRTLPFDRRLVLAGYRLATPITSKARVPPGHHGRADGRLPAEPAGQPAG
jgi:hypothetical protein